MVRKNTVPKRAFRETPVLGCATMPQTMIMALVFLLFALPFMFNANAANMGIVAVGAAAAGGLYMFFSFVNNELPSFSVRFFLKEALSSRPMRSCGIRARERSAKP